MGTEGSLVSGLVFYGLAAGTILIYFAVITDNLLIPARSIDAMARATSP